MIRAVLIGSTGRMGKEIIKAAQSEAAFSSQIKIVLEVSRKTPIDSIFKASPSIVIDFSLPDGLENYLKFALQQPQSKGLPSLLSGTTGLKPAQTDLLRQYSQRAVVVYSANMSLGIQWFMAMIESMPSFVASNGTRWKLEEHHHANKKDSPSGTALALKAALESVSVPITEPITSIREGSEVGRHTLKVSFGYDFIEINHQAVDRLCFAHGALKTALWLSRHKAKNGFYSLRDLFKS